MSMKILGISAFYHDSAAVLTEDDAITAAAQEERFTRRKHDPGFPGNAVKFCLQQGGLSLKDLDAVVFYDKPLLKLERLLETYYTFAPRGFYSFLSAVPVWIKEKVFLKKLLRDGLAGASGQDASAVKLLFTSHHLSHAASAFFPSPFDEAAILTLDGVGEWATASISHGKGNSIRMLKELRFPHSLGLLYSAFTYYLGFKVNSGEYKLMGLAPYGSPGSPRVKKFEDLILEKMISVKPDGSVYLDQKYFNYATGLTMTEDTRWEELFGFPRRKSEGELSQEQCDLAMAIQHVTEDIVLKMAAEARRLTGAQNLCLAGGVALNCVANSRIMRENIFDGLWIQPAAGDGGGALGAALAAHHIYYGEPRKPGGGGDGMRGALLGPEYTERDALAMAEASGAVWERLEGGLLYEKAAELLDSGAVLGWHQGREEWGPRALGNRSILADPRSPGMQRKLNLKIKNRESFRPFAPSVLAGDAGEYFESGTASPYMLLIDHVQKKLRKPGPSGRDPMAPEAKLGFPRSELPAVTHLDYSARLQTVDACINPGFHALLSAFKKRTGCGMLVNTSFNVRGEPIVSTPADAYRCFMATGMDYLVIGNLLFDKKKQPAVNPLPGRHSQSD